MARAGLGAGSDAPGPLCSCSTRCVQPQSAVCSLRARDASKGSRSQRAAAESHCQPQRRFLAVSANLRAHAH
eukprot:642778-Rhodomonas_salina.1